MHPMTLYDVATAEHRRATRVRAREHALQLRRRERAVRTVRGGRAPRATSANPTTTTATPAAA